MNNTFKFYYSLPHDIKFGMLTKVLNRIIARILKRYLDRTVPNSYQREASIISGINTNRSKS